MNYSEKICTGFGHRDYFYLNIENNLTKTIISLIEQEKVYTFYTGGMGNFDLKFISVINYLKNKYQKIKLFLIVAYFSNNFNTYKNYYEKIYDGIIIPEGQENVYPKYAIKKRNRWMVEVSDFIISGVRKTYGGAFDTIKYAQKQSKNIINVTDY